MHLNDFLPIPGHDLADLVMTGRDLAGAVSGNQRLRAVLEVFWSLREIDSGDFLPFPGRDLAGLVMTGRDLARAMSGNHRLRVV